MKRIKAHPYTSELKFYSFIVGDVDERCDSRTLIDWKMPTIDVANALQLNYALREYQSANGIS